MPGVAERNALVFVQIPTHFREMIRVAELLQDAPGFRPIVLFMTNYAGVQDDIGRCMDRGMRVITADDLYRYLPHPAPPGFDPRAAVMAALYRLNHFATLARARITAAAMGPAAALGAFTRECMAGAARGTRTFARRAHAYMGADAALTRARIARAAGRASASFSAGRKRTAAGISRLGAVASLRGRRAAGAVAAAWRWTAPRRSFVRTLTADATAMLGRALWACMRWCVDVIAVVLREILPEGVRERLRPVRSRAGSRLRATTTAIWILAFTPRSAAPAIRAAARVRRVVVHAVRAASRRAASLVAALRAFARHVWSELEPLRLSAGRRLRIAITAVWIVASARRSIGFHPVGALSRAARILTRELWNVLAVLRELARRVAQLLLRWAAPRVRSVLLWRIPSVANAGWLQRLPSPVRMAVLVIAGTLAKAFWVLALPLHPLLRRVFTAAFGIAYRRAPDALPPDIRAQHYVWRMVPRLLEENEIELVLLPEDNFYYFTNLFVKEIHARGGKAVIVPFTIVNVLEWAEAFKSLVSHDAEILMNRVVAMLFPQWCYRHKGKLLVMPPQQVLSNEALGVAPPIPWLINSGRADAIAAESLFMADYYRKAGIPEKKIRFTGALADDVLHRMLVEADPRRASLYRELELAPDRPMILCALPPNQLAGDGRPQCAFSDYLELLAAFVEPLERLADDYNVVVSLHPRITAPQARVLEGRRLRVSRESVAELVPLSRIYVASCSATIRLAISCGIPVVNYDVFVYDYDDFKKVPGVVTVDRQEHYVDAIERLAGAPEHYRRLRELQLEFAREQTVLDGKAGQRMLELFDQLMSQRTAA